MFGFYHRSGREAVGAEAGQRAADARGEQDAALGGLPAVHRLRVVAQPRSERPERMSEQLASLPAVLPRQLGGIRRENHLLPGVAAHRPGREVDRGVPGLRVARRHHHDEPVVLATIHGFEFGAEQVGVPAALVGRVHHGAELGKLAPCQFAAQRVLHLRPVEDRNHATSPAAAPP